MYADLSNHRVTQQRLQERIAEAQECHAQDRRLWQQLRQALNWLGQRFIAWSQHVQTAPRALELQGNERI